MLSLATLFLVLSLNDLTLSPNWEADAASCWDIQILPAGNKRMTYVPFAIAASKYSEGCNNQRAVSNKYRPSFACFSAVSSTEEERNKPKKYSFIVI